MNEDNAKDHFTSNQRKSESQHQNCEGLYQSSFKFNFPLKKMKAFVPQGYCLRLY